MNFVATESRLMDYYIECSLGASVVNISAKYTLTFYTNYDGEINGG
jgi:hypothetical protein